MKFLFIFLIRLYKAMLRPFLPGCCRFTPSCSNYALSALEKRTFLKAVGLITWRICRCHPFSAGGHDPVS